MFFRWSFAALSCFFVFCLLASDDFVVFDEAHWDLNDAQVTQYQDRTALTGKATLKEVVLENGVIECDIAIPDVRRKSYPGINFHIRENGMAEHLYIRPHRAPIYGDAIQYAPKFHDVSCWQFCNGLGFTNRIEVPADQWNHLKVEIHGKQARVYWNDMAQPVLVITDLMHGKSKGGIEIDRGPGNAPVYFSNFRVQADDTLSFEPEKSIESPKGSILDWKVSRSFPAGKIKLAEMRYPRFFAIANAGWMDVHADSNALVNVSKIHKRSQGEPDLVFARKIFQSDTDTKIRLDFGYSDEILLFFNGKPVFHGISHYQRRDPSFLGVVGYHDAVYVDAVKGRNEIFMILKEWFGGWGFMAKADKPLGNLQKDHSRITEAWQVSEGLQVPESVLYDPKRDVLYVTNFNPRFLKNAQEKDFRGYISKLAMDGKILEQKWIERLHAPTGMAIYKDKLFTLERRSLAEIDITSSSILKRYTIPKADFPNDLAIDDAGNIFISDTSPTNLEKGKIIRFSKGQFDVYLDGIDTWRPNSMYVRKGKLYFGGTAGDPHVKVIDLNTGHLTRFASLGAGTIDGLRFDQKENLLASHWEGQIYSVTPSGNVTEILDGLGRFNTADFEYIPEKKLLIIPTFFTNQVMAFTLDD